MKKIILLITLTVCAVNASSNAQFTSTDTYRPQTTTLITLAKLSV